MKLLTMVFAILLFTALTPTTAYANSITVEIDGVQVDFDGQDPVNVAGRTLVPVRGVFEALGFNVSWNASAQQITLTGDNVIILTIGSSNFTTDGQNHTLDVPAQIIGGRTMVPLRAVLESAGHSIGWDGARSAVLITANNRNVAPAPQPQAAQAVSPGLTAQEEEFIALLEEAVETHREWLIETFANVEVTTEEIIVVANVLGQVFMEGFSDFPIPPSERLSYAHSIINSASDRLIFLSLQMNSWRHLPLQNFLDNAIVTHTEISKLMLDISDEIADVRRPVVSANDLVGHWQFSAEATADTALNRIQSVTASNLLNEFISTRAAARNQLINNFAQAEMNIIVNADGTAEISGAMDGVAGGWIGNWTIVPNRRMHIVNPQNNSTLSFRLYNNQLIGNELVLLRSN